MATPAPGDPAASRASKHVTAAIPRKRVKRNRLIAAAIVPVASAVDLGFSDPNDVPADSLAAVKITTLPGEGSLTNNGAIRGFDELIVPATDRVEGCELITAARADPMRTSRAWRLFRASEAALFAFDLEADSMYHFQEKVCLIQIATETETLVIDPLKIEDLSPLKPVMANRRIRKVLHGADYDIRSLYNDFYIEVKNLLDTEVC